MKILNHKVKRGNQDIIIAAFGDFQYGNPACSVPTAKKFLKFAKDTAKRFKTELVWVGIGDYTDLLSPSNRLAWKQSGIYSSSRRTIQARTVEPIIKECRDILAPYMAGKTIAMAQGHHYMLLEGGLKDKLGKKHFHTDSWLASELGTPEDGFFFGSAIIKLEFPDGTIYRMHACHGEGNSVSNTYGLQKLLNQARGWSNVQMHIMGHTHKPGISSFSQLSEVLNPKTGKSELVAQQIPLITGGSFLRSFTICENGAENYPETKQLTSVPLGGIIVLVRAKKGKIEQVPMALL